MLKMSHAEQRDVTPQLVSLRFTRLLSKRQPRSESPRGKSGPGPEFDLTNSQAGTDFCEITRSCNGNISIGGGSDISRGESRKFGHEVVRVGTKNAASFMEAQCQVLRKGRTRFKWSFENDSFPTSHQLPAH
ncbi:uncharacterized protein LOC143183646 [Calliopsis andreniformis]|uniref:uncharacterized protein LOC143183646 n=1 Tax=Calliopsis andreniformis TaxID=337506 RepID=UPI003FCC2CAA